MRLDRVLSEGEAQIALRRLGFDVHEAEGRPGLYEMQHSQLGGTKTVTVEQLCFFAEGAASAEQLSRGVVAHLPN